MHRATSVLALVLLGSSMAAMAGDSDANRIRSEIVTKADSLFSRRYTPPADKPLRAFDRDRESRPADAVIYWFNTNYVARLVFATDGFLARVELLPEALLHSDSWTSVPDTVELGPGELQWMIAVARQLRPIGEPGSFRGCAQSGGNLYCFDSYELAEVNSYRREDYRVQPPQSSLKEVTIAYKKPLIGIVSELKTISENERQFMLGPLWYRLHKGRDQSLFDAAAVGSMVSLTTLGCAGNELVCDAFPAPTTPQH
jgi:hypothetical protein